MGIRINNGGPNTARDLTLTVNYTGDIVKYFVTPGVWEIFPMIKTPIATITNIDTNTTLEPVLLYTLGQSSVNGVITSPNNICNPNTFIASANNNILL